jgi:hypothetical protein
MRKPTTEEEQRLAAAGRRAIVEQCRAQGMPIPRKINAEKIRTGPRMMTLDELAAFYIGDYRA